MSRNIVFHDHEKQTNYVSKKFRYHDIFYDPEKPYVVLKNFRYLEILFCYDHEKQYFVTSKLSRDIFHVFHDHEQQYFVTSEVFRNMI
jgi:hypothetical protein